MCSIFRVQLSVRNILHGILQGSILGPLFFVILKTDLLLYVQKTQVDLFPDDRIITASAAYTDEHLLRESLCDTISNMVNWAAANNLPLNESQTKTLLVTAW